VDDDFDTSGVRVIAHERASLVENDARGVFGSTSGIADPHGHIWTGPTRTLGVGTFSTCFRCGCDPSDECAGAPCDGPEFHTPIPTSRDSILSDGFATLENIQDGFVTAEDLRTLRWHEREDPVAWVQAVAAAALRWHEREDHGAWWSPLRERCGHAEQTCMRLNWEAQVIGERDARIADLEKTLGYRDCRIKAQEQVIAARDAEIERLRALLPQPASKPNPIFRAVHAEAEKVGFFTIFRPGVT
jgi:hypothetical protein